MAAVPAVVNGESFLDRMSKAAKVAFQSTIGGTYEAAKAVLDPRSILSPGPVGKSIIKTAAATSSTIKAAGTGIEKGFKWATIVLVLIVGLWVWSLVRPPR